MRQTTRLQHAQGFFKRLGVLAVQDQIVARQNLLEILRLVVDDHIRAEALDQLDIFRARRRRNCRAEMLGELDGKSPHTTGAGLDEDLLTGLQLATSTSACQAVSPTSGMEAASSMLMFLGFSATSVSFMAMNSANVPTR